MRTITRFFGGATLALSLVACGGGGGDDGIDDIASFGGEATTTTDDGGGGGGGLMELSDEQQAMFEEAMLEYAACMREQGIDFPDPEFGEGGRVTQSRGGAPGDGPDPEEMEAADEVCAPIMEEVQAQMPHPSPEEQEEMRRQGLEFAECMREHGIEDFRDPEFGENGEVFMGAGAGAEGERTTEEDQAELDAASEAYGGPGGDDEGGTTGSDEAEDG